MQTKRANTIINVSNDAKSRVAVTYQSSTPLSSLLKALNKIIICVQHDIVYDAEEKDYY